MLGLVRLQKSVAGAGFAAGAADHLVQELKGALGRARVAVGEAEIGIDDADEVEHREVMALGDKLRADNDVEAAGGDVGEFFAHALDRGDEIARQHQHARLRKQVRAPPLRGVPRPARRRRRNLRPGSSGRPADAAWRSRNGGRRACLRKR